MAKRSNKNNNLLYIVAFVILIAIAAIFGEKSNIATNNNEITNNIIEAEKQNANDIEAKNTEIPDIAEGENLVVHYLDFGQSDSILIQSNGKNMLIDAGTNAKGKIVVNYLQNLGVKKIDYLVGTHPHEDHIGGLDDVINSFEIENIYMPKVQTNTKTFEDVLDAISNKNLKITSPNVGDIFNLGSARCEIMACGTGSQEEQSNLNLSSIVIRITYANQSFLFTGDAEKENEEARSWPQTTVLKVRTPRLRHKLLTNFSRPN